MKVKKMSQESLPTLYAQIRTPNMLPDRSADVHLDPDTNPADVSVTKQSFAQECDINYILKNNALIAPLTAEQYSQLNFIDLGDSIDYHSAKNYLIEAENSFMSLAADIRARFQNNPGLFLDFVQNPANADELVKMGLAVAPINVSEPAAEPASAPAKKTSPKASSEAQE